MFPTGCAELFFGRARKTDNQPYWPPQLSHEHNANPLCHPEPGQTNGKGHGHAPNHDFRKKQLSPCPTSDRVATVVRKLLVSFSKNFRASFRNSFRR